MKMAGLTIVRICGDGLVGGVGVLSELATFHPPATLRSEIGEHADTANGRMLLVGEI